jgi:hypothetical protein
LKPAVLYPIHDDKTPDTMIQDWSTKMNVRWTQRNREQGQSLVEFAVSGIVILLLLVAIADFGRAFFTYLSMRDAAQEGASYGSICPLHYEEIRSRVLNTGNLPANLADHVEIECKYWFDINGDEVVNTNETWSCDEGFMPVPGYGIHIKVIYPRFVITTPLLGSIIGNEISLQAEVTDTILRVVSTTTCP